MEQTEHTTEYSWHVPRLIITWVVALLLALAVVFFMPIEKRAEYLVLAIGAATILSFVMQLGTAQRDGFITRTAFSTIGSAIIVVLVHLGALFT